MCQMKQKAKKCTDKKKPSINSAPPQPKHMDLLRQNHSVRLENNSVLTQLPHQRMMLTAIDNSKTF